jgi:ABC-type polysaccharide/polyol phosphate export permease
MDKLITGILAVIGAIVVVAGISLITAFPIKWCWNYVMPYLFALKTITWGQAWCLSFLAHSLIKASQTNNK